MAFKKKFTDYFSSKEIFCHLTGLSRNEIIMEMLKRLAYNRGIGNVDEIYNMVLKRLDNTNCVIAPNIAVPHARLKGIEELTACVATIDEGVSFYESEPPVKIMILILTPVDNPSLYLQVLAALGNIFKKENILDEILKEQSPEKLYNILHHTEFDLPDYICAGDIMNRSFVSLKENDTLSMAIDIFVSKRRNFVPVVDEEKELVGVVSTDELLRVCLPDYILWMDDLSPIINFEPFRHVLQNEKNTWLTEIMTHDYAFCDIRSPAIKVAEEIVKNQGDVCYVLDGKKLVGTVTMRRFIDKIMRE